MKIQNYIASQSATKAPYGKALENLKNQQSNPPI